jgi:enterochelin esterase-like enzyme
MITLAVLFTGIVHFVNSQPDQFSIEDHAYGHARRVWVLRPTVGDDPPKKIFIFLGQEYLDQLDLPRTLVNLVTSGKVPSCAAVIVDTSTESPAELANRAKLADFMSHDLMDFIAHRYGPLPDARNVIVSGFSVGGLAAAYIAYRHPEQFGNVLAQSGAFWRGNEGASDPPEWLTQQLREKARLPIRFYVEVGAEETHAAPNGMVFIEANRHLRDALQSKGYDLKYVEVPDAKHEPGHWRAALPAGIEFLAK